MHENTSIKVWNKQQLSKIFFKHLIIIDKVQIPLPKTKSYL